MEKLPIELREHVASFLKHSQDLANLARTSSLWLGSTRRILYSNLTLRSDLATVQLTLDLLKKNDRLKKAVTSLNIITAPGWCSQAQGTRVQQWLSVKSHIRGMINLRRIKIHRFPRTPAGKPENFFRDLFSFSELTSLEEIWCTDMPAWSVYKADEMDQIPMPQSVKKIVYHLRDSPDLTKFFSSTFLPPYSSNTASRLTVLSLSLCENSRMLTDLKSHRLPHLKTLLLTGFSISCEAAFLALIAGLPSITHLSILQENRLNLWSTFYVANEQILKQYKGILPNLLYLSANPRTITQLSKVCDRVKLLRSLSLDFNADSDVLHSMGIMCSSIPGGFPNLKHLSITNLVSGEKANNIADLMSDSTELEWWTGGFYCHDSAAVRTISDSLSVVFPNLCRVDICVWTISESSPSLGLSSQHMDALNHLARENTKIQKIYLYMPHLNESREICAIYRVQRIQRKGPDIAISGVSDSLHLSQIYEYKVSGPHLDDRRVLSYDSSNYTSTNSILRWDDKDALYDPWIHDVPEFSGGVEPSPNEMTSEDDEGTSSGHYSDEEDEDSDSGGDSSWKYESSAEGDSDNND